MMSPGSTSGGSSWPSKNCEAGTSANVPVHVVVAWCECALPGAFSVSLKSTSPVRRSVAVKVNDTPIPCPFWPTIWAAPWLFSGFGADTVTGPSPAHSTSITSLPGAAGPDAAALLANMLAVAMALSASARAIRLIDPLPFPLRVFTAGQATCPTRSELARLPGGRIQQMVGNGQRHGGCQPTPTRGDATAAYVRDRSGYVRARDAPRPAPRVRRVRARGLSGRSADLHRASRRVARVAGWPEEAAQ